MQTITCSMFAAVRAPGWWADWPRGPGTGWATSTWTSSPPSPRWSGASWSRRRGRLPTLRGPRVSAEWSRPSHLICDKVYHSDIQPATDTDETPTPTITFNCLSPDENKTDDNEAEDAEASLTQYQLSDLSTRLGGTQLYISRDTGLDLTHQLEAGTGEQDTSKYAETMEELEQLMARLEDVFQSFRYTRKPTTE